MKFHVTKLFILAAVASMMFFGYQCGSPEFTGAKVYIQQKNYKEAIRLLEIEVQKNPQNDEAWFFLGGLKADQGDLVGMNKAFDAALKISPKHTAEIRAMRYNQWGQNLNAGVNYLEKANSDSAQYFDKSINAFQKAIEAWPDTSLTYRYLGYVYNNKGDFDHAIEAFQKAWDKGKDLESMKRMGAIYLLQGDDHKSKFENANALPLKNMKILEELKHASTKDKIKELLGAADDTKKGPKNSTKEDWMYKNFQLTVSFDGDKVVDRKFAQPYQPQIDSSEHKTAQVLYDKAVKNLEIARAADPKDNETLQRLLKGYVESNRIEPAVREFEKVVASDTTNLKTNRFILGVLYRTIGRYDDAIGQFKEANKMDPSDCEVLFDIAATYYNWGVDMIRVADEKNEQTEAYKAKFQAALPYMEKVSECKKDDINVWETMGTIYARLGQQDKAMKAFDQADKIRKGGK
ncbi:MAG TPA: tetratricopeptide repeat protein [Bacteroidota bacterium]|nr:tetratricopeptide repeat protein [Bacteroidota bacterium]